MISQAMVPLVDNFIPLGLGLVGLMLPINGFVKIIICAIGAVTANSVLVVVEDFG